MNIQQINGSGHNIWIFLVTAIIALLVTAITWYLIEETNHTRFWQQNNIISWQQDIPDQKPSLKKSEYNLGVRVFMLLWLVIAGHLRWTIKSGALRAVLTKSDAKFLRGWSGGLFKPPSGFENWTACEYVHFFMNPHSSRYHEKNDPFNVFVLRKTRIK